MRALVAFDPGNTTGYVILKQPDPHGLWQIAVSGTFTDEEAVDQVGEIFAWAQALFARPPADITALYEQIRVFHSSVKTEGVEVIGIIRAVAARYAQTIVKQDPGAMQGPANWKIDLPPDFRGHANRHKRDALYHVLAYLVSRQKDRSVIPVEGVTWRNPS